MRRALAIVAALACWTSDAGACTDAVGFQPSQAQACDVGGQIPLNGILRQRQPGSLIGAERLAIDPGIAARFPCSGETAFDCVPVVRVMEGTVGVRFLSTSYTGCVTELTVNPEPDKIAPIAPVIADVTIDLVREPRPGCNTCGDLDRLSVRIDNVVDDIAPTRLMQIAIYVGATEDEARTRAPIDHLVEVFEFSPTVTIHANLGEDRKRPLVRGLLSGGRHCIAVESVDWAGNFSPRSAPMCFDHTDASDPHVVSVESEDSCASTSRTHASFGSGVLVALTALAVRLQRRRRSSRR